MKRIVSLLLVLLLIAGLGTTALASGVETWEQRVVVGADLTAEQRDLKRNI